MRKDDNMTDEMLDDVLALKVNELADLETGSDEAVNAAKVIKELADAQVKREEVRYQRKDASRGRLTGIILGIAGVFVPALVTVWSQKAGYALEHDDGTPTSPTFRNYLNNPFRYYFKR